MMSSCITLNVYMCMVGVHKYTGGWRPKVDIRFPSESDFSLGCQLTNKQHGDLLLIMKTRP